MTVFPNMENKFKILNYFPKRIQDAVKILKNYAVKIKKK